jgi:bacillopeptidase F (M6 metalloprotease family)
VQFLVSEKNGTSWTPQAGKYTRPGNYYQEYGKPMYDGVQASWVRETIDLSNYKGKNIKVGFKLVTDAWLDRDGFYFDDFVIKIIKPQTISILNFPDTQPTAFYNATTKKIVIKDVENATSFSLFNIEGKLLDSFNVNNNYYEINVAKLQSGIYLLKSNTGEAQKVVIY